MTDTANDQPRAESPSLTLWLAVSAGAILATALFAGSRAKPPWLFPAGYGFGMGIVLRLLVDLLQAPRNWRLIPMAAVLTGLGFLACFFPSYQRSAREWEHWRSTAPTDPLAVSLLNQLPAGERDIALTTPPYSVNLYLSQRFPGQEPPWPEFLFAAECVICMTIGALCVGLTLLWRKFGSIKS